MSVETCAIAGIGLDILTDKDDYEMEKIEEKYESLKYGYVAEYGSYWTGETAVCLLAKDPVNGIDLFIDELKKHGFPDLSKDKLKFIAEVLYC